MTTQVRAHTRRKPSKRPEYIRMHEMLKADVEAMRRGELPDPPISAYASVWKTLAKAIGLEMRA